MSHQTGIKANESLTKIFGKSKTGKLRVIKVSIESEQLCCTSSAEVKRDWEKDYDKLIGPLIEPNIPCYILYRLDVKTSLGYAWLLISWVPDDAAIRQKMVYASTKATLKSEFGSAHITEELHATSLEETTLAGYYGNMRALSAPAPLTMREEELAELKKVEVNADVNTSTRKQTICGIICPLTEDAAKAVNNLIQGSCNYLQFRIDLEEERIHIVKEAVILIESLSKHVPEDHARYHLFLFKHSHNGRHEEPLIFIYSMPGYACSVRERMMYSSCKAPFLENLHARGLNIVKSLEISEGAELTDNYIRDELYPKEIIQKPAFVKPKGPPNRGAKRVTRTQE